MNTKPDNIRLIIDNKNFEASLFVSYTFKINYPSVNYLMRYLKNKGIVYGIKEDVLTRMVKKRIVDTRVIVANGKSAEPGTDGYFKLLIEISTDEKPTLLKDGSVDFKKLKKLVNVHKGEKLIKRIPPVSGKKGYDIFENEIEPPLPKDVLLREGNGIIISKKNDNNLIAEYDGTLIINSKGNLEVRTEEVIYNDIDYSTGNISFTGDLRISGSVRSGFSVYTDGNLVINGNIENAEVSCTENLTVNGGAFGSGKGSINCKGSLVINRIENFNVSVKKDINIKDNMLHTNIKTDGRLTVNSIIGGNIEALDGVEAKNIGTAIGTKTCIKINGNDLLKKKIAVTIAKKEKLQKEKTEYGEEAFSGVIEGMDAEGTISKETEEKLQQLKIKRERIKIEIDRFDDYLEELENNLKNTKSSVIKVKNIFPNTVIKFGSLEKKIFSRLDNVTFKAGDRSVLVSKS